MYYEQLEPEEHFCIKCLYNSVENRGDVCEECEPDPFKDYYQKCDMCDGRGYEDTVEHEGYMKRYKCAYCDGIGYVEVVK